MLASKQPANPTLLAPSAESQVKSNGSNNYLVFGLKLSNSQSSQQERMEKHVYLSFHSDHNIQMMYPYNWFLFITLPTYLPTYLSDCKATIKNELSNNLWVTVVQAESFKLIASI